MIDPATVDLKVSSWYPSANSSYWDTSKESMVCGYETCWEDGTDCIPEYNCKKCCNGAYEENGRKCGGSCLETGSQCNLFTTCSQCCMLYNYNVTLGHHICTSFDENPFELLADSNTDSNSTNSDNVN
jgi:hypothetical protein